MSLSSDELNYLVWRYLQEAGLETPAYALLKDSPNISNFDSNFGDRVPIGSLVNLVQKGLLYTHVDQLLDTNPQRFSLFEALNIEKSLNNPIEFKDRFQLRSNDDDSEDNEINGTNSRENSPDFIKVLTKIYSFESSFCSKFNPKSPEVLAFGGKNGQAKIVVLIESDTKELTLNHSIQDSDVTAVSWAPLGHLVLTAIENGELRLWTADGKLRNVLYLHHAPVLVIEWSPDSNYFLTTDADNSTVLWSVQSGGMVQHFDLSKEQIGSNGSVFPTSSSNTVANSSNTPTTTTTGTSTTTITTTTSSTPTIPSTSDTNVESVGIDATWIDNTRFVIPGLNGAALVFSIGDRTPLGSLIGHRKSLSNLSYNPENSLLLTASDDKTIRIWNGTTFNNNIILTGHTQPITSASWIDNNFIISTSLDSSIRLWDLRKPTKEIFAELLDGIPILIAQISPDKSHIVVGTLESTTFVFSIDLVEELKLKLVAEYQSEFVRETRDVSMSDGGETNTTVEGDVNTSVTGDVSVDINGNGDENENEIVDENENENVITSLDWSSDSKQIVITYSLSESVVVKL